MNVNSIPKLLLLLIVIASCSDEETATDNETKIDIVYQEQSLNQGERLFTDYCSVCHSKKLDEVMTGPALAHITKNREIEWLIDFTKYPMEMINHGDSIALCMWWYFKPSIKGSFINSFYGYEPHSIVTETKDEAEEVIDSEIRKIYQWIEYQSVKQNLDTGVTIKCDEIRDKETETETETDAKISSLINKSGIYRFDKLEKGQKVKRLELIPEKKIKKDIDLKFHLILPEQKGALPFIKCEGKYILLGSQGLKEIRLPTENRFLLYGTKYDKNNFRFMLRELDQKEGRIKFKDTDFSYTWDEISKITF